MDDGLAAVRHQATQAAMTCTLLDRHHDGVTATPTDPISADSRERVGLFQVPLGGYLCPQADGLCAPCVLREGYNAVDDRGTDQRLYHQKQPRPVPPCMERTEPLPRRCTPFRAGTTGPARRQTDSEAYIKNVAKLLFLGIYTTE